MQVNDQNVSLGVEGYPLSEDYENLWDLIQWGYRIVGWVVGDREFPSVLSVVGIRWCSGVAPGYFFGSPGCSWKSGEEQKNQIYVTLTEAWNAKNSDPLSPEELPSIAHALFLNRLRAQSELIAGALTDPEIMNLELMHLKLDWTLVKPAYTNTLFPKQRWNPKQCWSYVLRFFRIQGGTG